MRNVSVSAAKLFTIGYERAGFAPFLDVLRGAGVRHVIDVRDLPLSRRAGFSKTALRAGLAAAGLGYTHSRALGTPPAGREANKRRRWAEFWAIVEGRLQTPEAGHALAGAVELAQPGGVCLLCFEADPHVCHRLRVAQLMCERAEFWVEHLRVG